MKLQKKSLFIAWIYMLPGFPLLFGNITLWSVHENPCLMESLGKVEIGALDFFAVPWNKNIITTSQLVVVVEVIRIDKGKWDKLTSKVANDHCRIIPNMREKSDSELISLWRMGNCMDFV